MASYKLERFTPHLTVGEQAGPQIIDRDFEFSLTGSSLAGMSLEVAGLAAGDRVGILSGDDITTNNGVVRYNNVVVGIAGGGEGDSFVINFLPAATPSAVKAVLNRLSFEATSDQPVATRELTLSFIGADGTPLQRTPHIEFAAPTSVPFSGISTVGPAFFDIDGDGRLDLVSSSTGVFYSDVGAQGSPVYQMAGALPGDLADPDLLYGTFMHIEPLGLGYLVSDGHALHFLDNYLRPWSGGPVGLAGTGRPIAHDLDGNGVLDLIIPLSDRRISYFPDMRPDGPVSEGPNLFEIAGNAAQIELLDVDLDGDLDLIVGRSNGTLRLYRNEGTATAARFVQTSDRDNPFANLQFGPGVPVPVAVDIDADGDADLVVANSRGELALVRNDSTNGPVRVTVAVNAHNDAPEGRISITGTAKAGSFLWALHSVTDADGLSQSISVHWQRSADLGLTWTDIGTGAIHLLTDESIGSVLRAVITYVDDGGTTEALISQTSAIIADRLGTVSIVLGADDDVFQPGVGVSWDPQRQHVDGGGHFTGDTIDFSFLIAGASVNLATGAAAGWGFSHTLLNFEHVRGGHGSDDLTGDDGDNTFFASTGDDAISGAGGSDTYDASTMVTPLIVDLQAGTARSAFFSQSLAGVENIVGGLGNDRITGDGEANALSGAAGNDRLDGGSGNDILVGGAGKDALVGGSGVDTFKFDAVTDSAAGADRDVITDFRADEVIDVSAFAPNGGFRFLGQGTADRNVADGAIKYYSYMGNTYVVGNVGGSIFQIELQGDSHNLTPLNFLGIAGAGTTGNDTLEGSADTDWIYGLGGSDTISGRGGKDYLFGGEGADTFNFDAISDSAATTEGRDVVGDWGAGDKLDLGGLGTLSFVGLGPVDKTVDVGQVKYYQIGGNTYVVGNTGSVAGSNQADFQIELTGNHTLTADSFAGLLVVPGEVRIGTEGNDTLRGTGGDDALTGLAGRDVLHGGIGSDTFVFTSISDSRAGSTRDVIVDWNPGDRIDLSAIDADPGVSGDQAFSWVNLHGVTTLVAPHGVGVFQAYGSTFVIADADGDGVREFQVELLGTHTLTSSDFLL